MNGKFITILIAIFATAFAIHAQSNYAVVRGSIFDPEHRPIPGARIHMMTTETGVSREAASDGTGLYEIDGLEPGAYSLTVDHPGFKQGIQALNLEVGQQVTLDLQMQVGANAETVTVEASGELLKTQDASVGEVVDQRSVSALPLNGRMLIDLILTVPGAHISHGAATGDMSSLYWRPGQRSAVSIGGSRPNGNYFLLDGATNTDPTFSTQNFSASPDAVQEFQVQTGSYSAEMGGAGGGQINIVTRSGSSHLHGTAYEFLRNGAMDALSFEEMNGMNFLVQNNFGASLGGPIPHAGKTFFFANYEGLRLVEDMTMVDTVPTAAEDGGDFSQSGVNIYDPNSSVQNPNYNPNLPPSPSNPQIIRQQFSYNGKLNVIPPNRINQAASIMLNQYTPQPNSMNMGGMTMMGQPTVIGAGNDANNYLDVRKERMTDDQGTFRVDHSFANGDTAFLRYSAGSEYGFMPEGLPGFGLYHDNLAQQSTLAWTRAVSSRTVNMASLAVSRLAMSHTTESANKNDIVDQLGITGTGYGGPKAWGAPYFTVQGYSAFGDNYLATPMEAWDTVIEGRDTLSWQMGRHDAKFGAAYQRYIWPMWGFFQNRGYYQFTNGFTTRYALNDGSTGSALASFLLGLPAARQGQAGVPQMNLRQWYADGYAEDTWRLTSKTTIDYGLRYEFMSPLVDIRYTNSNLDLSTGTPQAFIGGQNGYPRGLMYPNLARFAPRLGLAQSLPQLGLVWHVAYGIFYTPVDMNTWCNQRHNVPYVFPETSQSDPYTPSITTFNFPTQPVLGTTVVSFTSLQLHAPPQYVQQWSTSFEKQLGSQTTLEVGYLGAGGFHLQRSHLINNSLPGPGLIQPRRPFPKISFVNNSVFPSNVDVSSSTFPVSTINLLENTSQSWYDAGYVNIRRRYARRLSFLANYTFAKSLENAPDFRSPMFESAIPQNDNDLAAEKGPGCDVRQRAALSAVYNPPSWNWNGLARALTRDWRGSTEFQVQTGFPLTISVFGDTANAGTVVGENPIRANVTGDPVFPSGTRNATNWFSPAAFAAPPAYTFGNSGRNSVYGPGMESMDLALARAFSVNEKTRFETRAEFFNALNHTNLGTPNRFVNTSNFGSITEITTPGREIQLSARLSF